MKVFVTGTRGIPNIPGGVETHCQHLYPLIAQQAIEVRLCRRSAYVTDSLTQWEGVQLEDVLSPKRKSFEAIVHTFRALLAARRWGADIVHIHAIGPALLTPVARLLGLKVVLTHHGPDYERQKWSGVAKAMLKLGEYVGGRCANEVIVISRHIQGIVLTRCARDSQLIPNGVALPEPVRGTDTLARYGLTQGQYLLAVARFVPEKGLHDLIDAYSQLNVDWQLVLAGDADHEDEYSKSLKERAAACEGVVLTGFVTGEPLRELFAHAGLFVMPSYHEGLPIALLEAMSFGLPVLVSDIPANLEVDLGEGDYFPVGNVERLAQALLVRTNEDQPAAAREARVALIGQKYDWRLIAQKTVSVYNRVMAN